MSNTKYQLVSRVEEGQQAVVIVLLAQNESGAPITEGQKQTAACAAQSALELVGAEVASQSSAIMFDPTSVGEVAKLTATLETVVPGASEDETDETEEPTEPDTETEE